MFFTLSEKSHEFPPIVYSATNYKVQKQKVIIKTYYITYFFVCLSAKKSCPLCQ